MSTELTDQLRAGMERVPAQLPPGLVRGAYRRYRRRRVTARAIAAVGTVAVAAVAATVVLAKPATPTTQTTAYVVRHVTQALDAMPAGTIMFMRVTYVPPGQGPGHDPQDTWARADQFRMELFTQAGQPVSDDGNSFTRTTQESVQVDYQKRTWRRDVTPYPGVSGGLQGPPKWTCSSARPDDIIANVSYMVSQLRTAVSCGELKAAGSGTVAGVTAVKLVANLGDMIMTYWVNASTYLPIRVTTLFGGVSQLTQDDVQWLPPTPANLAQLNVPIPAGFTQAGTGGPAAGNDR